MRYLIRRHDKILNEAFPFKDSFFQSESENPKNKLHLLEIQETRSKFIRSFNAYSSDYTISIKNTELIEDTSGDEQVDLIIRALEEMIEVAKRCTNFRNHDRINIVIRNPILHYPVSTGYQRGNSTQNLVQNGGRCKREICLYKGHFAKPIKDFDQEKNLPICTYTESYIFFDYVTQQETGTHIPNLVMITHDFNGNVYKFKINYDFCKWSISNDHKDYTCIAHYAKGYDSQFILKYDLYEKTKDRSDLIEKTGYNLVEMWKCKWIKSTDYKYSEKPEIIEPLNKRYAFFGGITNTFKL